MESNPYPVTFAVDYPDRDLDRLSTAFRIFTVIPIAIVLATVSGGTGGWGRQTTMFAAAQTGGILFLGPFLMILFRERYPQWWQDWNLQLTRFSYRVTAYLALMDDKYPSTVEQQSVRLNLPRVDAERDLNRWLPLVKWLLAIPHYILLFFLSIAAFVCVIASWFAIVFTGRYPRGIFDFVEGVMRWHVRVWAYAILLVTDDYPPFSLDG